MRRPRVENTWRKFGIVEWSKRRGVWEEKGRGSAAWLVTVAVWMKFLVCAIRSVSRQETEESVPSIRAFLPALLRHRPTHRQSSLLSAEPVQRNGRGAALRHLKRPSTDSRSAGSRLFVFVHRGVHTFSLSVHAACAISITIPCCNYYMVV